MWDEAGKEIYEMTTELQSSLSSSTFALVNYTSVKPYDKLLIDLACLVKTRVFFSVRYFTSTDLTIG